jgi:YHS domain-containing protein
MSGLDFVAYASAEKLQHIPYGQATHRAKYAGYSFMFETEDNMLLFEAEPQIFAPQYGGFCAWAIAGETDPSVYPWSADCLGPAGDPRHWKDIDGRLYFFRSEAAQQKFLANSTLHVHAGDKRWSKWFEGGRRHAPFATLCTTEANGTGPVSSGGQVAAWSDGE